MLRATQVVLEERIAKPILIGRPDVMRDRIKRFGLTIQAGDDFEIIDPEDDPRYRDYVATYLKVAGRKGVTPDVARTVVRTSPSVIGALAVHRGEADALICGLEGRFTSRLDHIRDIVGLAPGAKDLSALSLVIAHTGVYFLADTHVRYDPSAEEIAETAVACASPRAPLRPRAQDRPDLAFRLRLRRHAIGAENAPGAALVAGARARPRSRRRDAGRHRAIAGRSPARDHELAPARRGERADLPNLDAGSTALQLTRVIADALPVGPILIGPAKPAHVLTPFGDGARDRQHDRDRSGRGGQR